MHRILPSLKELMDLTSFDIHLYKLADAYNPGIWTWLVSRFASPCPVACHVPKRVGLCDHIFSGLQRSPFDFGSNVSLSTLRPHCYRRARKTRYVVVLVSPSTTGLSPARWMRLLVAPGIPTKKTILWFNLTKKIIIDYFVHYLLVLGLGGQRKYRNLIFLTDCFYCIIL